MNILKSYTYLFLLYPGIFLAVSLLYDLFRGSWDWFHTASQIMLLYYIFISISFYSDLKKLQKEQEEPAPPFQEKN